MRGTFACVSESVIFEPACRGIITNTNRQTHVLIKHDNARLSNPSPFSHATDVNMCVLQAW